MMEVSLENVCLLSQSANSSVNGFIWEMISQVSSHSLIIVVTLVSWIIFELLTRNGRFHHNSANGFSPVFNRFVGSGLYFFYYSLILILPQYLLGEIVHCITLPFLTHLLIFVAVKKTLMAINFWKY